MRQRKLPALEKEHSHARVPGDELEARMTQRLVTSAFTPLALLHWQLTGRGPPLKLTARTCITNLTGQKGGDGSTSGQQRLSGASRELQHHNILACRLWALSQVPHQIPFTSSQCNSAQSIQIMWKSFTQHAWQCTPF